jgi:two-component system, NarL family, capsular synthesis sensor histidine kinase RcsC
LRERFFAVSGGAESGSFKGRRILLVDDVSHVAQALQEMLTEFGCQAEVASGGEEALRKYGPDKYDLVITDYSMPGMNGADLTQAIRARSPRQLILLMISPAQAGARTAAERARADYMLPKPFSVSEFQAALEALFSSDSKAV